MTRNPVLVLLLLALPMEAGYLALNRLADFKLFVVEYLAISLAVCLFYLVSVWWITSGRLKIPWTALLLTGLVFRLTLLPLYPSLTDDPHRYRWEGKLQAAGGNPYTTRPDDPGWTFLRDPTWPSVNRKDLPTSYGPLTVLTHRFTYSLVSRLTNDERLQVWLFKAPYLLFDLATVAPLIALLRRLGLPAAGAAIYFWSPLVVVEYWSSGHNDSLVVFFMTVALWAACAERWTWSFGALWMAVLSKLWPILLFPLFLWNGGAKEFPRRLVGALVWIPLPVLLCLPFRDGAGELSRMVTGFAGGWSNNASLFHLIYAVAGRDYERSRPMVVALLAAVVLLIAWRRPSLPRGTLWLVAAMLFLSANCFPWYLIWLLPLLAIHPQPALLLWTALVPLSYHVLIPYASRGAWQEDPFYLVLEYAPVYAMLFLFAWRRPNAANRSRNSTAPAAL